ncbi:MAG: ATP-binding protein [Lachnospiraceae bacterium]|nr:ATP-binding protein [Lachnospiraceae bacterium]
MERQAMQKLIEWKNKTGRKPLILMGARQVGKTWLMKAFGERYFEKTAYISFYNNSRAASIFEMDYDADRILTALSIEAGVTITPGNTLIIFDEIQNAPRAFESLKYFCEDAPEYHVIAAGSLLGVAIHEGVSYPVGKVDLLNLYPLSFREYLRAVGEAGLADALETKDYSLIDVFSEKYLYHLKNYYYIGGMPAVVSSFIESRDYNEVRRLQKDILTQYRGDFGKHVGNNELMRINMVWDCIPLQLAKENKKFFFGQIKKGARSADYEIAIQWLIDCGLVYKVNRVNSPQIPLSFYKDPSVFKLFVLDIGLLSAMSETDPKSIIDGNKLFTEFKGALTEQFVLQQLLCDTDYVPYYFGTDSSSFEQDFMIQKDGHAIPIEVKAESNVRSQSLKAFNDKYAPAYCVRFSALKYMDQGWMVNIPLYAVCNV